MRALLLLVHGSPRPESNDDMFAIVEQVRARGEWPIVEVGFLDCNDPDIPSAIDRCISLGADEIVGVPYLLHSGRHLTHDLPRLFEEGAQRHPGARFLMGDYIGSEPRMAEVIRDRIAEASAT